MIILPLILFVPSSYAANILAIIPTPSYSHQVAYTYIWRELSLRGHKVTVLTTDPLNDPSLTNLTEVDLHESYSFIGRFMKNAQEELTLWTIHRLQQNMLSEIVEGQLKHRDIQSLIYNMNNNSFDVILVEIWYLEYLAFAEIYNCPKILISSLDSTTTLHHLMGNPYNPILYPEIGADFYGSLTFKERVVSTLHTWNTLYNYYYQAFNKKNEYVKTYFNVQKTVQEMLNDIDMMFINVNPILQPIRALGPATITIGGYRKELSPANLSQDLAEFLDKAVNGFVYFSLGSNIKSNEINKDSLKAINEALGELPYKVLWKFEDDDLPNKPENVKIIKWAPQLSVLAHPNIKLFVTQGGLQSMEETFYNGVPSVVIPFFGDQGYNARVMETKGYAVVVERFPSVNKIELRDAILEVINNPKYRNNVKRLKQLALDSPMTGLEKAVWWTEYVIRNKGAKHLRNPAADIPFYQYYLIDVISFLVFLLILFLVLLYIVFAALYLYAKTYICRTVGQLYIKL